MKAGGTECSRQIRARQRFEVARRHLRSPAGVKKRMDKSLERIVRAQRRRNAEARIAHRLATPRREAARDAGAMAGTDRRETFDIDLAVEGGNLFTFIRALIRVAEESDFFVDFVGLSTVISRFRSVFEKRGTVCYARRTAAAWPQRLRSSYRRSFDRDGSTVPPVREKSANDQTS